LAASTTFQLPSKRSSARTTSQLPL
jgi:hypothetical protein